MKNNDSSSEDSIDDRECVTIPRIQYDMLMDSFIENEIQGSDIEPSPFAQAVSDAHHDESDDRSLERIIEECDEPVPTDDRSLDEICSQLGIEPIGRHTDE